MGVWTHSTLAYLEPSVGLAFAWADREGRAHWRAEMAAIIRDHHKLTPSPYGGLAEAFRKADAIDLSCGLLRFGLSGTEIGRIRQAFPNAGFHLCLLRAIGRQLRANPLHPFPFLHW